MTPQQQAGTTKGNERWNFGGVQSVTGSPVLAPDNATLLFYFGGQQGFSASCVGPGSQTGVARLRRDGFAAMETGNASDGGIVLTQPLRFDKERAELFVNFAGAVTVEVLDATTKESLLGSSERLLGDHTLAQVAWPGKQKPLRSLHTAERPIRLKFVLGPATKLFSFWTAVDGCGASGGFLGGGGPGAPDGIDSGGRC